VKLEIEQMTVTDKGTYKLVARNEKGEATSQVVEVTEIPEEKGEKPKIVTGLKSIVSISLSISSAAIFYLIH
jgi:hypothetical protein